MITAPDRTQLNQLSWVELSPVRRCDQGLTSSHAIAERPRNASCLSVVSFNSTIRRPQSSVISYFRCVQINCSVLFSSAYSLMRGDLCRKQSCTVSVYNLLYTTAPTTVNCWSRTAAVMIDSQLSRIALCAYPTCIRHPVKGPRRNIAIRFGTQKLEWFGYPTVKKVWGYDYSLKQNSRTWQTDRQTPHDGIGRACIASRGKMILDPHPELDANLITFRGSPHGHSQRVWSTSIKQRDRENCGQTDRDRHAGRLITIPDPPLYRGAQVNRRKAIFLTISSSCMW